MSERTEKELLDEIAALTQLVAGQERAAAAAVDEIRRTHATLSWRMHRRFEPIATRLLRNRLLREPYRMVRRAIEIWVEHGFLDIFRFGARKIEHATRGNSLIVEEHVVPLDATAYARWLRRHAPGAAEYAAMRQAAAGFPERPLVSVLMAVDRSDPQPLRRTIESLRTQLYDQWEALLAIPASSVISLKQALGEAADDARVRLILSAAPTLADSLPTARGSIVAFVEAGDALAPEALLEVVRRFNDDAEAELVYSDQDSLDAGGRRTDPFFKPEWDPELLLSTNVLGPFTAVRRRLVDEMGGFRTELAAGQAYDLMLRATEKTTRIARVPRLLCHLGPREASRDAIVARHAASRDERRAIEDALGRRGRSGCVETRFTMRGPRCYTTRVRLAGRPLVSIVIPTRDQAALLRATVDSILERTQYDAYEIHVVDNDSRDPEALEYLASLRAPCSVHRWAHPFNYSAINNFGVAASRGEQLLFLNNDVEVINPDWLMAMLEYAQLESVGAVGAKLLYPDGTIQHAGIVLTPGGIGLHAFRNTAKDVPGAPRLADLPRNCTAVTGACMMVRRRVFEELGGFDEQLRVVLNDVDLCLRLREKTYQVIYTPYALLYHHEGASRRRHHPAEDEKRFKERWSSRAGQPDQYYNPNLSDKREDWSFDDVEA